MPGKIRKTNGYETDIERKPTVSYKDHYRNHAYPVGTRSETKHIEPIPAMTTPEYIGNPPKTYTLSDTRKKINIPANSHIFHHLPAGNDGTLPSKYVDARFNPTFGSHSFRPFPTINQKSIDFPKVPRIFRQYDSHFSDFKSAQKSNMKFRKNSTVDTKFFVQIFNPLKTQTCAFK